MEENSRIMNGESEIKKMRETVKRGKIKNDKMIK
jgi:hypothetical protein